MKLSYSKKWVGYFRFVSFLFFPPPPLRVSLFPSVSLLSGWRSHAGTEDKKHIIASDVSPLQWRTSVVTRARFEVAHSWHAQHQRQAAHVESFILWFIPRRNENACQKTFSQGFVWAERRRFVWLKKPRRRRLSNSLWMFIVIIKG